MTEFDAVKMMKSITVTVRLKRLKEMTIRVRFALWLMRVAVWISGMGFEYLGVKDD